MKLATVVVLLLGFVNANDNRKRLKRFLDPFRPFSFPVFEQLPGTLPWDQHVDRINHAIHDVIDHPWPIDSIDFRHYFGNGQNHWEEDEWLQRPRQFEHHWPPFPAPHFPWEAVDVTGTGRTFSERDQPWWKGPNVCVEKKEVIHYQKEDDGKNETLESDFHHRSDDCKETETSYLCETNIFSENENKTVYVKQECCHGFKRRYDGQSGCIEIDLKDLVQTLNSLVLTRFLETATDINFEKNLREMNYTIFAPTNEAFEYYEKQNNRISDATITSIDDARFLVGGHAVEGFYKSGDFIDERVMMTANKKTGIRINLYFMPEKIITANCVRVTGINNYARNGNVHIVNKVLPQPSKSVLDIVSSDPRFSILKRLLSQAGLVQTLRDPAGNFTLFAPSDSVFTRDESYQKLMTRLMDSGQCIATILKNHLLPNVICTPALSGQARTVNMLDRYMILSRNEDNKLFVNGIQIVARDIMGTNGVVHIIDGVLLPDEAITVTDALARSGMDDLLHLIVSAGLQPELDTLENFTFFAPTVKAVQRMSPFLRDELQRDKGKLRETILYHFTTPTKQESDFINDLTLNSVNGKTIRINQYGEFPGLPSHTTAQCTRVITTDKQVCGGVMHLVERILLPPKENIMAMLDEMEEFSILRDLLNSTDLGENLRENGGPFTLFAPTNNAFRAYSESSISNFMRNKIEAEKFLKVHILQESLCCAGVHHSFFGSHQARTIGGSYVPIHRRHTGWLWYGPARIIHCDMTAKNGVVHIIDKVLYHSPRGMFNFNPHDEFFDSQFP